MKMGARVIMACRSSKKAKSVSIPMSRPPLLNLEFVVLMDKKVNKSYNKSTVAHLLWTITFSSPSSLDNSI